MATTKVLFNAIIISSKQGTTNHFGKLIKLRQLWKLEVL